MLVRGRPCNILKHAYEAMLAERPPVGEAEVFLVLKEPDRDDGKAAHRRIGRRTLTIYYTEHSDEIEIGGVSATRSRLRA